jgi:hypothetical protein
METLLFLSVKAKTTSKRTGISFLTIGSKKHGEGFKKYDAEMRDGQDCYYLSLMLAPHKYPDAEQHIFSAFQLAINEYHSFKSP